MDRPRNHAVWLGAALALFGLLSYFALFARWPLTRDLPWLNFALLGLAVGLSARGLVRAWERGTLARVGAVSGLVLSGALTGLLGFYVFYLSYGLPSEELGLAVGEPVPALTLTDHEGRAVDLARLAEDRVLLVFYRGHW